MGSVYLKSVVCSLLAAVIGTSPILQVLAEIPQIRPQGQAPEAQTPIASVSKDSIDLSLASEHPLLEMLRQTKELPPIDLRFSGEESILDRDPFFLRSQSWKESSESLEPGSLETSSSPTTVQIKVEGLSGSSRILELQQALQAVYVDEDFVLLSAQDPKIFEQKKAALSDNRLEGLFVLRRSELQSRALSGTAVPVYFMPLPGLGWTGTLKTTALPTLSAVAIHNQHDESFIPVTKHDLETIIYAESINLQLSTVMALRLARETPGSLMNDGLFPTAGSTAGFGLWFTGQNLATPAKDFYSLELAESVPAKPSSHTWLERSLRDALGLVSVFAQTRQATPEELELLRKANEALFWKGVRVFSILGLALGVSVILRHTAYRETFEKRREATPESERPKTIAGKVVRYGKENLDVYAHACTLLFQTAGATAGNFLEVMFDRLLPQFASSDKTLIRRFLNKTFLFSRNSLKNVPVNWDTWVKGTLVIGGMDTALVALQVYYVVPMIADGVAKVIPALQERVDKTYDVHNPLLNSYNQNETIRNGIAYATAGAASYSGDLRSQLELMFGSEVDRELQRRGVNILTEEGKAERQRVLDERVDVYMKKMGLPGNDGFLFDYYTLYRANQKMSGYLAEGAEFRPQAGAAADWKPKFVGEQRPGLVLSSLNAAIRDVKRRLKDNPEDAAAQEALPVLLEIRSKARNLTAMQALNAIDPFSTISGRNERIQEIRDMRQALVLLTYAGSFGEDLKLLPSHLFKRFGERGARSASHFYRRAFLALAEGYQPLRSSPTEEMAKKFGEAARAQAIGDVRKNHPEDKSSDAEFAKKYAPEVGMLTELITLQSQYAEDEAAKPYKETEDGVFVRIQRRSLVERSIEAMKAQGVTFDASTATPPDRLRFYKAYRDELFSFYGIRADYEAQPSLESQVKQAATVLNDRVLSDTKFQKYLDTLSPLDRETQIAEAMAMNEVTVYVDMTLRGTSIHPLDPAQPGVFQKWRQSDSLRKEATGDSKWKIKTRMLRLAEATFASGEYQLGLRPWIFRNVPFAFDTYSSFQRTIMLIPGYMTTSYVWNKLFWGQTISYPQWFFFVLMLPTIIAPKQYLNRLFEYQRWQPMGSLKMTLLFGFVYSWFTFGGSFPLQLYAEDFVSNVGKITLTLGATAATFALLSTKPAEAVREKIGKIAEPVLEAGSRFCSGVARRLGLKPRSYAGAPGAASVRSGP